MAGNIFDSQTALEAAALTSFSDVTTQAALEVGITSSFTTRINQAIAEASITGTFEVITSQVVLEVSVITCSSSSYVPPDPTGEITLAATPGAPDTGIVDLAWNALSRFTYTILRGLQADGSDASVIASDLSGDTFHDSGLAYHVTYFYSVVGTNACGDTTISNRASATPNCTLPAAPVGLTAIPGPQLRQVILRWQTIDGYTYSLFRATSAGEEGDTPIVSGVSAAVFVDDNAPRHGWVYYTLKAVNACGLSDSSAEASVRLHCCTQWTSTGDCNCEWSVSPGATTTWTAGTPPGTDWTKPGCS